MHRKRSAEQAMIRQLKREGAAARSQVSAQFCNQIMRAVDVQRRQHVVETAVSWRQVARAPLVAALTLAAAFLAALGVVWRPAPTLVQQNAIQHNATTVQVPAAVPAEVVTAGLPVEDLFSAQTAAVQSLSAWQASANPLDEFQHDAQLAGQMALSALPLSEMVTD